MTKGSMTPTKAEALADWLFAFADGKAESIMLCKAAAELLRLSVMEAERDHLANRLSVAEELAAQYAAKCDLLNAELERERMRLTACGVVACSDTPASAAVARAMAPEYRSASCDDVARRVDECIRLRAERDALLADAERYRALRDDEAYPYAICIWDQEDGYAQDARKPEVIDAAIDAAKNGEAS